MSRIFERTLIQVQRPNLYIFATRAFNQTLTDVCHVLFIYDNLYIAIMEVNRDLASSPNNA